LATGSLYILVKYSFTSHFVIRGKTRNVACAGRVSVALRAFNNVMGIVGNHMRNPETSVLALAVPDIFFLY
jgi:hypothetical protein